MAKGAGLLIAWFALVSLVGISLTRCAKAQRAEYHTTETAGDKLCDGTQPYGIWVNTTTLKWRKCENGVASDLGAGAGAGAPADGEYITYANNATLTLDHFPSAADQVPLSTAVGAATWAAVPNCGESGTLNYDSATHLFSCLTDGGGGANVVEATVDFAVAGSINCTVVGVPYPCCTGAGTGTCGAYDATATVTAAWVTGTSKIICAPTMFATADRPDANDDALVDELDVQPYARNVGVNFKVKAHAPNRAFGKFLVQCTGV